MDRLRRRAISPKGLMSKGLSELLAIDGSHLLGLQRSYVEGYGTSVQLQELDLRRADDVSGIDSLGTAHSKPRPAAKRTLLDFSSLGVPVDNLEGMTFGPALPGARRLLLVISDNNFNRISQITEILAFAVRIRPAGG